MYRPLSLFIGLRYTRAKRRNQFISFVSLISLLGMILGVVALVVVMSVMNGFESELRNRILAVVPHAYIDADNQRMSDWQPLINRLEQEEKVLAAAPYVDGNIMLSRPGMLRPAKLNAVDPQQEMKVSQVTQHMLEGSFQDLENGKYRIIVGNILANYLGLYVGDEVSVILPRVTVTPFGIFPRVKRFQVSGVFQVGADLDSNTVFIHLADGQKLFQLGDNVKGLRLKLEDLLMAPQIINELKTKGVVSGYTTKTWLQTQGSLFKAVQLEKIMIAVLLLIIVAIAAFNIISILSMMVADKRSDIAVLRTMGASSKDIQLIFMIQGVAIGFSGILLGLLIGIAVALNVGDIVIWFEKLFNGQLFDQQVYFVTQVPSELHWQDVGLVTIAGILMSVLATIYPSRRAASIQPAEALRYE